MPAPRPRTGLLVLGGLSAGLLVAILVGLGSGFIRSALPDPRSLPDGGFENFPRSSRPRHLYVFNATNSPGDVKLMLATLQGVVNRDEPRIYLIFEDPTFTGNSTDRKWLDDLRSAHGVNVTPVGGPFELLSLFSGEVRGAIVYDPDLPDSINVATTLAGLRDGVVVHPRLLNVTSALGLPVLEDLRGRWSDKYAMYEWAFENLWPESNPKMLADIKPSQLGLRDYLVEHKVFAFNLRPLQPRFPREQALFVRILAATPRNIPMLGYIADEWPEEYVAVSLLSTYGKILVPTDYARDLSVHSGVATDGDFAKSRPSTRAEQAWADKIYVTFVISDGDNVAYDLVKMRDLWDDPARGTFPLGWTLSPFLPDLAPDVMQHYHETATPNDSFVGPPSGAGYVYPSLYSDLPFYLNLTRRHFRAASLDSVWLLNLPPFYSDRLLTDYNSSLGLDGIFVNYLPLPLGPPSGYASDGTPVLRSVFADRVKDAGPLLSLAANWKLLSSGRPLHLFVGLNAWGVHSLADVRALADGLGPGVEVVGPDEMFSLMRAASGPRPS